MSDIEIGSVWQMKEDAEFTCKVVEIDKFGVVRTDIPDRKTVGNKYDFAGGFFPPTFLNIFEPKVGKADMVNHPPHYKDASGIECIEVTKHMQFCGGNCFKYLYRAGKKGSTIEDLKKAIWYAERAWLGSEQVCDDAVKKIEHIARYRTGFIQDAMQDMVDEDWLALITSVDSELDMLESE